MKKKFRRKYWVNTDALNEDSPQILWLYESKELAKHSTDSGFHPFIRRIEVREL